MKINQLIETRNFLLVMQTKILLSASYKRLKLQPDLRKHPQQKSPAKYLAGLFNIIKVYTFTQHV